MDYDLSPGEAEFLDWLLRNGEPSVGWRSYRLSREDYEIHEAVIERLESLRLIGTGKQSIRGKQRGECPSCPLRPIDRRLDSMADEGWSPSEQVEMRAIIREETSEERKRPDDEWATRTCVVRDDFDSLDQSVRGKLDSWRPSDLPNPYTREGKELFHCICKREDVVEVFLLPEGEKLANRNAQDLAARRRLDESLRIASGNLRWVAVAAFAAVMAALFGAVGVVTDANGQVVEWKLIADAIFLAVFVVLSALVICGKLSLGDGRRRSGGMSKQDLLQK